MYVKPRLVLKTVSIFCFAQLLSACDSGQSNQTSAESGSAWEMFQQTDKQKFSVTFRCVDKPSVGDFQSCKVLLKGSDDKALVDAIISIDGGMKAHGHGLPTSPKLTKTIVPGQYEIEGLKFSMPGEWIVGFRISSDGISDQTVFKFSV